MSLLLLLLLLLLQEYLCGDISISNLTHPQWTEVTVVANIFSPGDCYFSLWYVYIVLHQQQQFETF
jgi:hypothetical protein